MRKQSKACAVLVAIGAAAGMPPSVQASVPNSGVRSCLALGYAQAGLSHATYNRGRANVVVGTTGDDVLIGSSGPDLVCGLGGDDRFVYDPASPALQSGDVFLGGDARDFVENLDGGRFYGGTGDDRVESLYSGLFDGGAGFDCFTFRLSGTTVQDVEGPCP